MDRKAQKELAERFRAMHHGAGALLLPNAWDAISARLFAEAGFAAVATSSASLAWALGYRDGEVAPWGEVAAATARIARVAGVPVSADIEKGYGDTPAEVGLHVAAILRAGAVGVNLEDSLGDGLRGLDDAVARLGAAREVAAREGVPMVLNARSDLLLRQTGERKALLDALIERCRAYAAAGADCVYPFGLQQPDEIRAVVQAVGVPVNITARAGGPDAAALAGLGVRRISMAAAPALWAMAAILDLGKKLRAEGDFSLLEGGFPYPDAQALFAGNSQISASPRR